MNYVVKMLKMKDEGFLINLIKNDNFSLTKIDDLIVLLVDFYQSQKSTAEIQEWGKPENLSLSILENIQSMQNFEGFTLPTWASQLIYQSQAEFLDKNKDLFLARMQENKILNCHGDLRAEHVYYADNQVQIFDCIEFNEGFRCIDQLNDLAFLMMDLEYRGRYDIAFYFMQKIMTQLEKKSVNDLLNFYKTYRAAVRGKVNSLKAQEHEVAEDSRKESQKKAQRYYQWALKYVVFGSQPTILAVLGGTATGKSTLSKSISKALPARHLNSDVIRKTIAGLDPYERTPFDDIPKVYSEEMNQRTYDILLEQGLQVVKKEGMVTLDATFRQKALMEKLKEISQEENIRLILLQTTAPEEIIKARLKARESQKTVSDMRLDTYRPEAFDYEYAIEDYGDIALRIDTTGPLEDLIPGVMRRLIASYKLKK